MEIVKNILKYLGCVLLTSLFLTIGYIILWLGIDSFREGVDIIAQGIR